jgi:hypothetical protein
LCGSLPHLKFQSEGDANAVETVGLETIGLPWGPVFVFLRGPGQ